MNYICDLCGKDIPRDECHGGKPKYCLACLEELKDEYPFKIYYERRSHGVRKRIPKKNKRGD